MNARCILILSVLCCLCGTIRAQEVTGNLEGRVLDSQRGPIDAVNIIVSGPSLQGLRGDATDDGGYFRVLALPVGSYTVKVQHLAYQEVSFQNVRVRLGKTTTLGEITLQSQVLELPAIVVSEVRPAIDPTSTSSGGNLEADFYRELPVSRDYRNIAILLPQANESFLGDEVNFAGSTGLENKYFVDGVETTDPYRGVTGTTLPYNIVKEIQIRTGGYEAEYRSSLGGIVNVITYSGGNDFHGQAFGFFANNQFSGDARRPALAPPTGDFAEYDFGLSLGGPVIHDKLWFFAAYNLKVEREDVSIPGLGFFEDKSTTHIFAGKLTWQASQKTNVVFSIFGDPSKRDGVGETVVPLPPPSSFENSDPYLMNIETGGISLSLQGTHIVSNNVLIESSLSRISRTEKNRPASSRGRNEPLFLDLTGTWSGGSSGYVDNLSVQTTLGIRATLLLNRHTFKTGFEFRDNRLDNDSAVSIDGQRAPDLFLQQFGLSQGTFHNRIPSLFVQDSWQINNRLRMNIGLRWDGQFLVGSDGKVAQKITDQYQPRIGIIYQPGELGSQKLFGSFGRFYQELAEWLSRQQHNDSNLNGAIVYDHDFRIDPSGGDSTFATSGIQTEVDGLEGQHYDEFTLGYEREVAQNVKVGARGIYRVLRQGIETAFVPDRFTGVLLYGNPGKAPLEAYPKMKREYKAFELTIEKYGGKRFNFLASYVLSRNRGNYAGLFTSDIVPQPFPNASGAYLLIPAGENATGLLPNDRTHVFKFSGFYRFKFGLGVGTFFNWQTGKPKNEFGFNQMLISEVFLQPRGSAGRLSPIWDLNLRFVYDPNRLTHTKWQFRLILDVFHLGSQREPVAREEVHFNAVDENGNPIAPNPNYDSPILFQPPMAVKFGLEVDF